MSKCGFNSFKNPCIHLIKGRCTISGSCPYKVADDIDKDKEIARLTAENERLRAENAELTRKAQELEQELAGSIKIPFKVIDKATGKQADEGRISKNEEWAQHLIYCDMDGFAVTQDGNIILLDETGKFVYCPFERFEIVKEEDKQ